MNDPDDPNHASIGRDNHTITLCIAALKRKLISICCPRVFQNDYASRSNNARSQKRTVLYMAMSYALTWALTWIPAYIMGVVVNNDVTRILLAIFYPLQGLYNLIVYMSPKVRHARNTKRGKLPWRAKRSPKHGSQEARKKCQSMAIDAQSLLRGNVLRAVYLDSWIEGANDLPI